MAVAIFTGGIQVNQFRNNASMNQGKNVENGWDYISKTNIVIGQIAGNANFIPSGGNLLIDPDLIDNNLPNAGGQSPNSGGNA
ncbi:MAG: hypothetical protein K6T29_05110 [Peptococcaceae bacterium]|nr:hypothetical protein [Peptococcaceae bacterium]